MTWYVIAENAQATLTIFAIAMVWLGCAFIIAKALK